MIRTSTQLKAKVRNISGSDSFKAQTLIRNFLMERFLERITLSSYRNNFILKGGMLVSSMVGLETRATMDIDTTVKALPLSKENAEKMIQDIISIDVPDGVSFRITKVTDIMEEHDYPGIRFVLEAALDKLQQVIKVDISTGDVITPGAIQYEYQLMFEERTISLWTYNLETLLAEKLETILARGTTNTRMRDFYDIYIITSQKEYDSAVLKEAFIATSEKRNTTEQIPDFMIILNTLSSDETMKNRWMNYCSESFYVGDLSWEEIITSIRTLVEKMSNDLHGQNYREDTILKKMKQAGYIG